jgi:hypothetical protein
MVAKANAAITNVNWIFPANTIPAPSQPIAADLSIYSTNNFLGWTSANSGLTEAFILNPGNTTSLEFSYKGNHSAYLNGSTLTLTSTISGVATGHSLTNIQLAYDTKWDKTGNTLTETWAYSLNGGVFLNLQTNAVTGNAWHTATASLAGLLLHNGDTIAFRNTFSGAAGNNGNLDFDNIRITSAVAPEPSPLALTTLGLSVAGLFAMFTKTPRLTKSIRQ